MKPALICCLCLCGCAPFPSLDDNITAAAQSAPYPQLGPLPVWPSVEDTEEEAMQDRVAALQARAERLRGIDIAALQ